MQTQNKQHTHHGFIGKISQVVCVHTEGVHVHVFVVFEMGKGLHQLGPTLPVDRNVFEAAAAAVGSKMCYRLFCSRPSALNFTEILMIFCTHISRLVPECSAKFGPYCSRRPF